MQAVIAVLFLCLIVPLSYLSEVAEYQNRVKDATIKDIDIAEVPDGVYTGEYNVDFIYARVEATIEDGMITELKLLEHRNERGGPAEVITDRILDEQKIDVDTVTGATNSSIVIKKAVENALENHLYS
ncbi:MAG: FMN-binding protein [Lachnospiraceae bacterium]|nr:FMN-binding protein [Lachnospiraceae bacterium]